jgi:transcriptional regulator with XRE-family HTH domain
MVVSIVSHSSPTSGIVKAHVWDSGLSRLERMRPRDVLAENLKALMAARPDRSRFQEITAASGGALTNGTLDRIRRAEVAITLDRLEDLAKAFGLEPWQLLVQGLNPSALPRLADASVLAQIFDAIQRKGAAASQNDKDKKPAHPLETQSEPEIGPALERAFNAGSSKREASKPGRVSGKGSRRRA